MIDFKEYTLYSTLIFFPGEKICYKIILDLKFYIGFTIIEFKKYFTHLIYSLKNT